MPVKDVFGPVLLLLVEALDGALENQASYRLAWLPDPPRLGRLVQGVEPTNLLAALYLQFARTVAESKKHRCCQVCGKWYEVTPGVNRADRLTCSAACRQRAHRHKVAHAKELAIEGLNAREIAKIVSSTTATVKRWLSQEKGK
jgi:hypothetical protein